MMLGVVQFTGVDIVKEVGAFAPLVKEFTFVPSGPNMVIELKSEVDNALINGIEVYSREVVNTQDGVPPTSNNTDCVPGLCVIILSS